MVVARVVVARVLVRAKGVGRDVGVGVVLEARHLLVQRAGWFHHNRCFLAAQIMSGKFCKTLPVYQISGTKMKRPSSDSKAGPREPSPMKRPAGSPSNPLSFKHQEWERDEEEEIAETAKKVSSAAALPVTANDGSKPSSGNLFKRPSTKAAPSTTGGKTRNKLLRTETYGEWKVEWYQRGSSTGSYPKYYAPDGTILWAKTQAEKYGFKSD